MTPEDHSRLQSCARVIESLLADSKKRSFVLVTHWKETLAQIKTKLLEPVEAVKYDGEHFKTDNPFV
jgi:ABC-type molybdenum transport system ATPase subunit/photorepair protein PhrA